MTHHFFVSYKKNYYTSKNFHGFLSFKMPRYSSRNRRYSRKPKSFKKKKYSSKRSYSRRASTSTKYPGFPKNRLVKMRYVTFASTDLGTNTTVDYVFRANNIFDPQYALGGHKAIGYDQWASFYKQYLVVGSKCSVQFGSDASINKAIICTVGVSNNPVDSRIAPIRLETGDTSYIIRSGFTNIGTSRLSRSFSAKKFFNRKDLKDNWDDLGADFGSGPTEEAYFHVCLGTADTLTASNGSLQTMITIDYWVLLGEPNILPQS